MLEIIGDRLGGIVPGSGMTVEEFVSEFDRLFRLGKTFVITVGRQPVKVFRDARGWGIEMPGRARFVSAPFPSVRAQPLPGQIGTGYCGVAIGPVDPATGDMVALATFDTADIRRMEGEE